MTTGIYSTPRLWAGGDRPKRKRAGTAKYRQRWDNGYYRVIARMLLGEILDILSYNFLCVYVIPPSITECACGCNLPAEVACPGSHRWRAACFQAFHTGKD